MYVLAFRKYSLSEHFIVFLPNAGEFGIVYKALLKQAFNEQYSETVAVKTLKGFVYEDLIVDLLKECAKMKEFDHPNILPLRGVCLDGGPAPYIVMPFMPNGSLLAHLKKNRESLVIDPESGSSDDAVRLILSQYTVEFLYRSHYWGMKFCPL